MNENESEYKKRLKELAKNNRPDGYHPGHEIIFNEIKKMNERMNEEMRCAFSEGGDPRFFNMVVMPRSLRSPNDISNDLFEELKELVKNNNIVGVLITDPFFSSNIDSNQGELSLDILKEIDSVFGPEEITIISKNHLRKKDFVEKLKLSSSISLGVNEEWHDRLIILKNDTGDFSGLAIGYSFAKLSSGKGFLTSEIKTGDCSQLYYAFYGTGSLIKGH